MVQRTAIGGATSAERDHRFGVQLSAQPNPPPLRTHRDFIGATLRARSSPSPAVILDRLCNDHTRRHLDIAIVFESALTTGALRSPSSMTPRRCRDTRAAR